MTLRGTFCLWIALFCGISAGAYGDTYQWKAAPNNTTWANALNWTKTLGAGSGVYPGDGGTGGPDIANFTVATSQQPTLTASLTTPLVQVNISAAVTLTLNATLQTQQVTMSAGTITGVAQILQVDDSVSITGGTLGGSLVLLMDGTSGGSPHSLGSSASIPTLQINAGGQTIRLSGAVTVSTSLQVLAGTFDLNATTTSTSAAVLINGGTIQNGTITSAAAYDARAGTASAVLAGAVGLNKTTAGTVTLSAANTYTGVTTLTAGTLAVTAAGALGGTGSGTTINGGTLDFQNVVYGAEPVTVGGVGTIACSTGTSSLSGTVALNAATTVDVAGTQLTLSGVISGASTLNKTSAGTLILSNGGNSYTGVTTLTAGTLAVTAAGALGGTGSGTTINGGTLDFRTVVYGAEPVTVGGVGTIACSTGTSSLSGTVALNAATTVDVAGTQLTLSGVISGASTLNKTSAGTLILSNGGNSYTGVTTLTAGTLAVTAAGALGGTGSGTTINGGTLDFRTVVYGAEPVTVGGVGTIACSTGTSSLSGTVALNAATTVDVAGTQLTLSGVISGASTLNKTSAGTLILSNGGNSYTGVTTLTAGTLAVTAAGALGGTGSGTTINGGTLDFRTVVYGAEPVTVGGVGTIACSTGTSSLSGTVALNAATTVDVAGTQLTLSGVISGASTLNKTSAGTLVLSGANTYSGATAVNVGTLAVTVDGALGTAVGGTTVAAGATLDFQNVAYATAEPLTVNGGTIATSTLTSSFAGAVTLGATSTVSVAGAQLTLSGVISGATFGITKTGTGTLVLSGVNTYTGTTTVSAGTLTVSGGSAIVDTGAVNINTAGATLNLAAGETIGSLTGVAGTFVTLGANTLTVGDLTPSTTYGGVISGTGGLTKQGTGTLVLSGANTYSGATAVNVGTLAVTVNNALGTNAAGTTVAAGATLDFQNVAYATAEPLTVNGGTIATSTLTSSFAGAVTLGATSTVSVAGTQLTLSGVISGATFGITKTGTGTLVLSGVNTYTDTTTVSAGTLTVSGGSAIVDTGAVNIDTAGATLNLAAGETIGSLTGVAGTFVTLGANTLTVGDLTPSTTYGGVISGTGGLTKQGTGTLVLSGANTYSGATAVNVGTLAVTVNNALGTNAAGTTVAAGATLDFQNVAYATAEPLTVNGGTIATSTGTSSFAGAVTLGATSTVSVAGAQLTLSGVISGATFGITKTGTGTLVLSGVNTYTGTTTVSAGTLTVSGGSAIVDTGAVNINTAGATLNLAPGETIGSLTGVAGTFVTLGANTLTVGDLTPSTTYGGVISGTGGLTKQGTGTLVLSGANTYSGATAVNVGTLAVTVNNALGTNAAGTTVAAGATLDFQNVAYATAEPLTVNGGTIATSTLTSSFAGAVTLGATSTVSVAGTQLTLSGVISGATFGITKTGTGTLVLSGMNTYTGTTTVSAGTLTVSGGSAIVDTGAVNINTAGATLNLAAGETIGSLTGVAGTFVTLGANTLTVGDLTPSTTYGGVISGTGGLTKQGTGTLVLSGANTYSGATAVNVGTLAVTVNNALGTNAAGTTVAAGATLDFQNVAYATAEPLTVNGGTIATSTLTSSFAGAVTLGATSTVSVAGTQLTLSGVISGATFGITKTGTGTLVLSGVNTYTDTTTVSAGTLTVSGGSAIVDTGAVNIDTAGATLNLAAGETIGSLTGVAGTFVTLGANTLTVGDLTPSTTYGGVISGTGGLTKQGTGTLVLSGANTYTGVTAISAGTLTVANATALGTTGGTSVAAGATLEINNVAVGAEAVSLSGSLMGTGVAQLGGVVTLAANSSITGAGTLTLNGAVNGAAFTLALDMTGGSVTFAANVTLGTVSTLGDAFNVSFTGASTGITAAAAFLNTGTVTLGGGGSTLTFSGGLATAGGGTNPSQTDLNGTIQTADQVINLGPTAVAGASMLISHIGAGGPGAAINIASVTGGGFALALVSRTGATTVAGSVLNVSTLTLQDADVNSTGTMIFNGAVGSGVSPVGTLSTAARGYAIQLNSGGQVTAAVTFSNGGTLTIGAGFTFTGGATATVPSSKLVAGTIQATGANNLAFGTTPTTVTSATTLQTGAGGTVTLGGVTITNTFTLTLGNGVSTTVNTGAIDGTGANSNLTINTTGAVTISGAVGATAMNLVMVTQSGGVNFQSTLSAATVTLTDTTAGQTIRFTGNLTVGTGMSAGGPTAYNVWLTGATNSIAGATVFANSGTLTISTTTTTFTGGVTASAVTGGKLVAGTIQTTGATTLGFGTTATTVTANATLQTGAGGTVTLAAVTVNAGATLTLGNGASTTVNTGAIDGAAASSNLTINTTGAVTISGAVGATAMGTVTVTQSGGVNFQSTLSAATVTLTDTTAGQTILFTGNLTVGTGMSAAGPAAYNVSLTGGTNTIAGATVFANTGTLTISTTSTTFSGGVTASAVTGGKLVAGTIQATGANNLAFGTTPTTVTGAATLQTGAGGTVTLGGVTITNTFTLTLGNGASTTVNTGAIDGTGANSNLTINTTGAVTISGAVGATAMNLVTVTNSAALSFNNTVSLTGALTQTNAATGATTFSGAVSVGSAALWGTSFALDDGFAATGAVAVTNTGVLTKNATGAIVANGGFSTMGAVNLASNITTANTALSIGGNLVLAQGATVTLDSGAGAGSITLSGTVDGTAVAPVETLTLAAGTGTVTLGGAVGTLSGTRLTMVTVSSCGAMNMNAAVNITGALSVTNSALLTKNATGAITANSGFSASGAVSLASNVTTTNSIVSIGGALTLAADSTIAAGNGSVTFGSTIDGPHNLAVTSILPGLTTFTGFVGGLTPLLSVSTNAAGSVTLLASISTTGAGGISLGATTVNAASTLLPGTGTSTLQSLAVSGGNLTLAGTLLVTTTVSISALRTLDDTAGGAITVGGNWTNSGTFTAGTGSVTATGTCALTSGGSAFYDLIIGAACGFTPQDNLRVMRNFVINAGGTYTHFARTLTLGGVGGVAGNLTDSNGGTQNLGTVIVDVATKTMTTPIAMSTLTINAGVTSALDIGGFSLGVSGVFTNNGTLYRNGTGETVKRTNTSGTVVYRGGAGGTIQTYGGAPLVSDYFDLQIGAGAGTYNVNADLAVENNLILNAGTLQANAQTITIHQNFDRTGGGAFNEGTGTVDFVDAGKISQVLGGFTFYNFNCVIPNKVIQFQAGLTITIAAGGIFNTVGALGTDVKLLSTVGNPLPLYGGAWDPLVQWRIDIPIGATFNVDFVYVECSYAVRVILPINANFNANDWTFNWKLQVPVTASWTHDTDHNGKIDQIEAQVIPLATLNMDFSQLTVIVEGYQVTGYGPGSSLDKFIINLAEHSSLDTDATPRWWISFNNSLKGIPGTNKFVFTKPAPPPYDVSHGEVPIDAAPPILGYTLGIAGKSEIFLHFSEPVYSAPATSPVVADFTFTVGANPALSVLPAGVNWVTRGSDNIGYSEILLTLNRALLPDDLMLPTVINVAATVQDKAAPTPNAITLPPAGHRVSDIGLGLPLGGLIEPVWAHDETQTGSFQGGIGLIQLGGFAGTKWLRAKQNLTVEGNIAALSVQPYPPNATGTKLWYDIDVAAALRNPGGVWLPGFQDNVTVGAPVYGFSGLVPTDKNGNIQARPLAEQGSSTYPRLRDFTIPRTEAKSKEGAKLNFLFEIITASQRLFTARAQDPAAADWYRKIAPWSFDLHELRLQRGGVQILSNTINPDKGEATTLQYGLDTGGQVTVTVFDLSGSIVNVLVRQQQAAGDYGITWGGKNRSGASVARGIYFIRIVAPGIDETRKVLVVR